MGDIGVWMCVVSVVMLVVLSWLVKFGICVVVWFWVMIFSVLVGCRCFRFLGSSVGFMSFVCCLLW